jgi:hypothetical protein
MFYRIAVVQNEKELFKYDCADWLKHLVVEPLFAFYKYHFFDEHSIEDLFRDLSKLDKYDAIFFATNSLNSKIIYDSCISHKELIEKYINQNHGLYVGYSSKTKERDFLPEKYLVYQEERQFHHGGNQFEATVQYEKKGKLRFENHPAINAHCEINNNEYVRIANNHKTIAGLYFDYLLYKDNLSETLDPLVVDEEKNRVLMYCSEHSSGHRVIISTLPIDWQDQQCLFANVVKYCTEGIPTIEIIAKKNDIENLFSREYLFRQLNLHKIAFVYKETNSLSSFDIDNINTEILIFDSSLKDADIDSFYKQNKDKITHRNMRILHYFEYSSDDSPLYKLTVHSAFQQIDVLRKQIILAIESRTPNESNKYSYDSNLLATFEAIKFLQSNQRQTPNLYSLIVTQNKKRLLEEGSYDAMYIASCTFFALWNLCDNNAHADDKYNKLKNYIKNNSDNISTYEKAQVLYLTDNLNVISDENKKIYIKEIIKKIEETEGEELLSYGISNCWRILGNYFNTTLLEQEDYDKLFLLIKKSIPVFGNFKSNPKVSIVANYVFAISKMIKNKSIDDKSERAYIHKFLFSAVGYLHTSLDDSSFVLWGNDIYSSCLAITALKEFHALSVYPIDEILLLSNTVSKTGINVDSLLEISNNQTNSLIILKKSNTNLKNINEDLAKNLGDLKLKNLVKKSSMIGGILAIFILVIFILPLIFDKTAFCSFIETAKSFYSQIIGIVVAISAILACIFTVLNYYKKVK